ncbi:MAG: hypothetical protein HUU37_05545 [Bdellovibrionales bacterium]|nr:hypothetical protein [Bdellovibrionales bacterium]
MIRSNKLKPLVISALALGLLAGISAWAGGVPSDPARPTPSISPQAQSGQDGAQQNTQQAAGQGSQEAASAGMAAMAMGTMMMAAGMASTPPNTGLIAAGAMTLMQGMQGMDGSEKLGQMANMAGFRRDDLGSVNSSTTFGTDMDKNAPTFSVDASALKASKASSLFDSLQEKTGLTAEDLLNGYKNGATAADFMKRAGLDPAVVNKALADNPNATAVDPLEKLGMTPEELAKLLKSSETVATGGGGFKSKAKSGSDSSLDDLFAKKDDAQGPGAGGSIANSMGLSPDVEMALNRAGLTEKSIFQMVTARYRARTPGMFGVDGKKPINIDDPFSNPAAATVRAPAAAALDGTNRGILD